MTTKNYRVSFSSIINQIFLLRRMVLRNQNPPFFSIIKPLSSTDFEKRNKGDFLHTADNFLKKTNSNKSTKINRNLLIKKETFGFLVSIDGWIPIEWAPYMTDLVVIADRNMINFFVDAKGSYKKQALKFFNYKDNEISTGYWGWEGNKKAAMSAPTSYYYSNDFSKKILSAGFDKASISPSPLATQQNINSFFPDFKKGYDLLHTEVAIQKVILKAFFSDLKTNSKEAMKTKTYKTTENSFFDFLIREACNDQAHAIKTLKTDKSKKMNLQEIEELSYNVVADASFLDGMPGMLEMQPDPYNGKMIYFCTNDRDLILSWCEFIETPLNRTLFKSISKKRTPFL